MNEELKQQSADGLEVVGYRRPGTTSLFKDTTHPQNYEALCLVADAQRLAAQLREELAQRDAKIERLRMQLVACGVVALANTPESAAEARKMHPDCWSASCGDVASAVDREMAYRAQLESQQAASVGGELDRSAERNAMQRQRDQYEKLLERECSDVDSVLGRLGLTPDDFRTDGGFLKVDSIVAALSPAGGGALEWAIGRWHAEVSQRPLVNVHRRALDGTWRQVIQHLGGDPDVLCGPSRDDLMNAKPQATQEPKA